MAALNPSFVPWDEISTLRGEFVDPPAVFPGLWTCGSLEALRRPTVALVGTRAASRAGKELSRTVARELSAAGLSVISGLALGIDAAAHQGALEAGAATIGILGGGARRFFPRRNRELAERMIEAGGAVCSPFGPDEDALPYRFLQRNGAVAALADAVVVIEAPERSGALNTAGWAAGRIPVLVFPGDVDRRNVAGCLALIRDGATLVRNATDILDEMRITRAPQPARLDLYAPRSPLTAQIIDALEREPLSVDQLIELTAATPASVLSVLTELEFGGVVARREGGVFARN
ncbi:MAG: DNA-processing protein DprA [Candidatus Baltobacteraceae bacterium]